MNIRGNLTPASPATANVMTTGYSINPIKLFGKPNTIACGVFMTLAQLRTALKLQLNVAAGSCSNRSFSTDKEKELANPAIAHSNKTPKIQRFDRCNLADCLSSNLPGIIADLRDQRQRQSSPLLQQLPLIIDRYQCWIFNNIVQLTQLTAARRIGIYFFEISADLAFKSTQKLAD